MLIHDLFRQVLIEPAQTEGVNRLRVVSGFATANMADRHMEHLHKLHRRVDIELVVGMTVRTGITNVQHLALRNLVQNSRYEGLKFRCHYVVRDNPVHAKTYCWLADDQPVIAFMGSANYTQTGFGPSQTETMTRIDGLTANRFFDKVKRASVDCLLKDIENEIIIEEVDRTTLGFVGNNRESVNLSLVKNDGNTPDRSGINWGQRDGRDRDQAYISIPVEIRNSDFFPERGEQFTVMTDDGKSFIMVRAQDGGKGLHTTQSNALLGEYLRKRMNIPSGDFVTRQHLDQYGRTDVTFTKLDDETYVMDFRSPRI